MTIKTSIILTVTTIILAFSARPYCLAYVLPTHTLGKTRWLQQMPTGRITTQQQLRFGVLAFHVARQRNRANSNIFPLSMCICIHCAHVTNCSAYHFVEEKHEQPHMNENPTFTPSDGSPTIHVNIRTSSSKESVAQIWAEHSEQQLVAEQVATEKGTDVNEERGEKLYDFSTRTTYEYDVVKCESYIHEQDCWVKNMPESIRMVNPHFIPS